MVVILFSWNVCLFSVSFCPGKSGWRWYIPCGLSWSGWGGLQRWSWALLEKVSSCYLPPPLVPTASSFLLLCFHLLCSNQWMSSVKTFLTLNIKWSVTNLYGYCSTLGMLLGSMKSRPNYGNSDRVFNVNVKSKVWFYQSHPGPTPPPHCMAKLIF